jgi:soluble lytic murein transglycosylase-like protein
MLTSRNFTALRLSAIPLFFSGIILAQPANLPATPSAADRQAESVRRMERSIARQQSSLKRQGAQSDGFFTTNWVAPVPVAPSPEPVCNTVDPGSAVKQAASQEDLDPTVIRAVIRQESAFRPCAVSSAGAMGLMQLMPATAERFHVSDPFDIEQNVLAGARYLKELLGRFHGDLKLALAAYNAGPERVDGDTPAVPEIPETQNYVDQIMKALEKESLERVKNPAQ